MKIITKMVAYVLIINIYFTIENIAQFNKTYTLKELCESSEIIVEAKVNKIISYWNNEKTHILSKIEFTNKQTIKSSDTTISAFSFTIIGGKKDGLETIVLELPSFTENMRSILFLNRRKDKNNKYNKYSIFGSQQGKFDIIIDEFTDKRYIKRDYDYSQLQLEQNGKTLDLSEEKHITIEQLLNLIKIYN